MDLYETFERLGGEPSVTFGCGSPPEVVGPLNPRSVQYGITYGSGDETFLGTARPRLWFNFNKYRPDLPPWRKVVELTLATQESNGVFEITFIDISDVATMITGDLKTVSMTADGLFEGVEGAAVISRDGVADNNSDGFKVTEELK